MDWPMLIHVAGGGIALSLGTIALILRKGSRQHQLAGHVFSAAMIVMAIPGGMLAYLAGKPFDMLSSVLALYLVATGWAAFRPMVKRLLYITMCFGGVCMLSYLTVEIYGSVSGIRATEAPVGAGYVFATILTLALYGDYRLARNPYDASRLRLRHLWRMNFGLLMATASFFGARPHLFPEWMQTSGVLLALTFAPLVVMGYWRYKLRASAIA